MNAVSSRTRQRRLLALLFAAYTGGLALIAFWPSPVDASAAGTLKSVLERLHAAGVPAWVNYALVESTANVALFLPFGFLAAAYLSERWAWLAAAAGIGVSCAIEAGQYIFLPDRFATIHDVMANSLGAVLGTLVVYAFRSRKRG